MGSGKGKPWGPEYLGVGMSGFWNIDKHTSYLGKGQAQRHSDGIKLTPGQSGLAMKNVKGNKSYFICFGTHTGHVNSIHDARGCPRPLCSRTFFHASPRQFHLPASASWPVGLPRPVLCIAKHGTTSSQVSLVPQGCRASLRAEPCDVHGG